jgi:O-methyltransferase
MSWLSRWRAVPPGHRWPRVLAYAVTKSRLVRVCHRRLLRGLLLPGRYVQARPQCLTLETGGSKIEALERLWTADPAHRMEDDPVRLYGLYLLTRSLDRTDVAGALAEVGVYRGRTAAVLRRCLPGRRFYLFDTFTGFAAEDLRVEASVGGGPAEVGRHDDTSLELVKKRVGDCRDVVFCPGLFPDSAADVPAEERFCLVHFDADLYAPARAACEFFFPRLVPGGMMIFHDYHSHRWTGVKRAVDEFAAQNRLDLVALPDLAGSAVLMKPRL